MSSYKLPLIVLRGAGDLATGVALRLYRAGLTKILLLEKDNPLAVRRTVAFSEAFYVKIATVENVQAVHVQNINDLDVIWKKNQIPLLIDPNAQCLRNLQVDILIDAILAKKNLGTNKNMAKLVIALGPGFTAGKDKNTDVHAIVETMRGHYLSRVIYEGQAIPNTGCPAPVQGFSTERVFWAEEDGIFNTHHQIGNLVKKDDELGRVNKQIFFAKFDGIIRGLLRDQTPVTKRTKLGDIDPRCDIDYCHEASDKALAIGGGVLEIIMQYLLKQKM